MKVIIPHPNILTLLCLLPVVISRIHHLSLKDDTRRWFKVTSFGYLQGGLLIVNVSHFSFKPLDQDSKFGFSVIRTVSDSLSPYMEAHQRQCFFDKDSDPDDTDLARISFIIDVKDDLVVLDCSKSTESISITDITYDPPVPSRVERDALASGTNEEQAKPVNPADPAVESDEKVSPSNKSGVLASPAQHQSLDSIASPVEKQSGVQDNKSDLNPVESKGAHDAQSKPENSPSLHDDNSNPDQNNENSMKNQPSILPSTCFLKNAIKMKRFESEGIPSYSFAFRISIDRPEEEGLYNIFFHSCGSSYSMDGIWSSSRSNLTLEIIERNDSNYLSAGEIPLPGIYFILSLIFFVLGIFWISVVKSKSQDAFKIHYIMGLLVFVKAFALLFHGINYQFIAEKGLQSETWAILYYITHFLKGALLFITIVLIGTGWAFIKHILSEKDKNLFMIVIPLQVLANIAEIITEESEEGEVFHNKWREIFILVDLLCCGAILFPVVWSIRHLQEAAHIDGKAATNLKKLKLFRRFYVIIVCYIYFTRIIVYLLKVTVPFKYEWMDALISHAGIFVFFVLTGYHFQPTPQNPYFRVAQDEDLELEEVLFEVTPNIYTENLSKKRKHIVEVNCDDQERLITKREASHDFD